ncbi:MAG: hypothetical protein FWE95_11440, partial [Planctomycetaceae bacterium]|jgi:hypothetical protein|nr:hypothetical protein [Planctomycetaceae bacterium]
MTSKRFEIGKTYFSAWTHGGSTVDIKIIDRTARTATVECNGQTIKLKVLVYDYVNESITADLRCIAGDCPTLVDATFYPKNIRQTGVAEEIAELVRTHKAAYSALVAKVCNERQRAHYTGDVYGTSVEELDSILMTAGMSKVEACEVLVKGGCFEN